MLERFVLQIFRPVQIDFGNDRTGIHWFKRPKGALYNSPAQRAGFGGKKMIIAL
jgi:hypothetical protein